MCRLASLIVVIAKICVLFTLSRVIPGRFALSFPPGGSIFCKIDKRSRRKLALIYLLYQDVYQRPRHHVLLYQDFTKIVSESQVFFFYY